MRKVINVKKLIYTIIVVISFLMLPQCVNAAFLYLEPDNALIKPGETFEISLMIDTEDECPTTTDTILLYNSENLRLISVDEPAEEDKFFPKFFKRTVENTIYAGAAIQPGGTCPNGVGKVAEITFEGVKDSNNIVSFKCTQGATADSNISLKKDRKVVDIIDCSKVNEGNFIVSQTGDIPPSPTPPATDGSPTPTPNPSGTITPTTEPTPSISKTQTPTVTIKPTGSVVSEPTPSILPETGRLSTTVTLISAGVILTLISVVAKMLL